MFLLRRTALRALSAKPAASLLPKTRSIVTLNQTKFRPAQQWTISSIQRRFVSDEVTTEKEAAEAAAEAGAPEGVIPETGPESGAATEVVPEENVSASEPLVEASGAGAVVGGAAPTSSSNYTAPAPSANGENSTLYVGNIFFEVTEQSLQEYFSRYGAIKKTRIVYDARGLSKGFGYVEFENLNEATQAIEGANQQVFQGRRLAVQYHKPRTPINLRTPRSGSSAAPSKTLFIGNMSFEMSDKDLSDLFREVRNVIDVRIAIDRRTGQPRGFAHADFIDVTSAQKAMEFLRGKELYGRQLRVDYSQSSPKQAPTGGDRPPRSY